MHYAVIDTETSDKFDFKKPADAEGQPRLAALTIIEVALNKDGSYRSGVAGILDQYEEWSCLVKPDGWTLAPEAAAHNGLTMEQLEAEGIPIEDALDRYEAVVEGGFVIVAHSAQFDCKVLRGELRRSGRPDLFEKTLNICTMRSARPVVPSRGWPTLANTFTTLTGQPFPAPTPNKSLGDARACLAIFQELLRRGIAHPPAVHYAKEDPTKGGGGTSPRAPF